MPIPDTPYTRKESYLNAIATGDSSGIPGTPYTREEMYLDAIAKGGGGGGGGSSTLSGLTDVDISNPTNGQTLVYNAETGKWENGAGGGGGANVIPVFTLTRTSATGGTATCNMSLGQIRNAIQNGSLSVAKFVREDYSVLYANLSFFSTDAEEPNVSFNALELLGGGDVAWHSVYVSVAAIEYVVETTRSYPGE